MTNKYISLIIVFLFILNSIKAEEGMWLLSQMNLIEKDMQDKGLVLSKEEIYSINSSSIKDGVVSFGGFCTAEIISDKGLLLTNHHCGDDFIRKHSSIEDNYLKEGFWAKNYNEELNNPGLYVKFLIEVKDVTSMVLSNIKEENDSIEEYARNKIIKQNIDSIINEISIDSTLVYEIEEIFGGNQFILFKYKYYYDIRLVGAPPEHVGAFGGDTDNWMWPRHTGDFSIFRIYSDSIGNPAKYSKNNIPYTPKYFFHISKKGVEEGDFSMILGFPGRTDRFLTSYGVKEAISYTNPLRIKIRSKKLDIYSNFIEKDEKVKLTYADDYSSVSNYWKYYIGQTKGLKRNNIFEKKVSFEEDFLSWCNENDTTLKKYGHVLMNISDCYNRNEKINLPRIYLQEAIFSGPKVFTTSYHLNRVMQLYYDEEINKKDLIVELEKIYKSAFHEFNYEIDKTLFSELLTMYNEDLKSEIKPDIFEKITKKYNNSWYKFGEISYNKSFVCNKEKFKSFIKYPSKIKFENDPIIETFNSIYQFYIDNMYLDRSQIRKDLSKYNRQYIAGIMEMNNDKVFYPNANSTMRLTYGSVESYKGDDAILYNYYTTHKGILEKEDSTNHEFRISNKLKKLIQNKDFEDYTNNKGELVVNFISSNDITGGNSGSPVLNGQGHLIGVAFDGNWEAMSCDISYEKNTQRTISVDIRYVLFIIDKIGEAQNLIDELVIHD